jgi:hypothetical protein
MILARMKASRCTWGALLAVLVVSGACESAGDRLVAHNARPARSPASRGGYFIQMPALAGSPGAGLNGGAVVPMTTNLPDGTIVFVASDIPDPSAYEESGFLNVSKGSLTFSRGGPCGPEPAIDPSLGFNLMVIVVPDMSSLTTSPR